MVVALSHLTHKPLPKYVQKGVTSCLRDAATLLGIEGRALDPTQMQDRINDKINELRRTGPLTPEALDFAAYALGALWGHAVCLSCNWQWVMLHAGKQHTAAVMSPDAGFVVFPVPYVRGLLTDHSRDQTSLLLFNMIRANAVGTPTPGAYEALW